MNELILFSNIHKYINLNQLMGLQIILIVEKPHISCCKFINGDQLKTIER